MVTHHKLGSLRRKKSNQGLLWIFKRYTFCCWISIGHTPRSCTIWIVLPLSIHPVNLVPAEAMAQKLFLVATILFCTIFAFMPFWRKQQNNPNCQVPRPWNQVFFSTNNVYTQYIQTYNDICIYIYRMYTFESRTCLIEPADLKIQGLRFCFVDLGCMTNPTLGCDRERSAPQKATARRM